MSTTNTPPVPLQALTPSSSTEGPNLEGQPLEHSSPAPTYKQLGLLDRFLALWILLAMATGVLLGNFAPIVGEKLQAGKFVGVAVPIGEILSDIYRKESCALTVSVSLCIIAIGLLVMMYPILCKVRYEVLHHVFRTREMWVQVMFSMVVNWIVAPLVMVRISPCVDLRVRS
jgi:ACR3 family arsenite transporter